MRAHAIALVTVVGSLAWASEAHATCDATCAAKSMTTDCRTTVFACETESCLSLPNGQTASEPGCSPIRICELQTETNAAAGTPCETDNDPCTSDVCGSATMLGVCTHVTNPGTSCGGACITGCCASPNSCPSGLTCPANGGSCGCPSTQKECNGSCVALTMCCLDTDCPMNATNHQHGVCTASGCVLACDTNYSVCNATCIPSTQCCSSSDCTTPPSACYGSTGTCTTGACTYPFADGTACNADSNLCTLDSCKSGTCVIGDAQHTVTCTQRECYSAPSCDPATGNCVDTMLANNTVCGMNGCSSMPGLCTAGACSAPQITCTQLDTVCQSGACNASGPVDSPCVASNKLNGTMCDAGKCVLNPACQEGACVGKNVTCTPSGPCRIAACDPMSGSCAESVAAPMTTCSTVCQQNASCDTNGDCVGEALSDGSPCTLVGCEVAATCSGGKCVCLSRTDFAQTGQGDGGIQHDSGSGCSCDMTQRARPTPFVLFLFVSLGLARLLRRRAR